MFKTKTDKLSITDSWITHLYGKVGAVKKWMVNLCCINAFCCILY